MMLRLDFCAQLPIRLLVSLGQSMYTPDGDLAMTTNTGSFLAEFCKLVESL